MGYLDNIHMGMVLGTALAQVGNMMWGLMMMMRGLVYMELGWGMLLEACYLDYTEQEWENLADVKLGGSYHKAKGEIHMMVGNLCYKATVLTFELIRVNCWVGVGSE
jgi:hypothetical protein